jgi:hypothetical protein
MPVKPATGNEEKAGAKLFQRCRHIAASSFANSVLFGKRKLAIP